MKTVVIADDLTGANDTGVQFATKGYSTSVLLNYDMTSQIDVEVVVYDTDSRSLAHDEAYKRVYNMCLRIKQDYHCDLIYKKVDSTLRGNIGAEMDAVYHAFRPDFIVFAPSFPQFGRTIEKGVIHVNDTPLNESNISNDPKNPMKLSYIPDIVKAQSIKFMKLIELVELRGDPDILRKKIASYREANIPYLLFDAQTIDDIARIVSIMNSTDHRIVWSGSAALAKELASINTTREKSEEKLILVEGPACIVIGSINSQSHLQLDRVLQDPNVIGFKINPTELLINHPQEKNRILEQVSHIFTIASKDIVLYLSSETSDVEKAKRVGESLGLSANEISNLISQRLGEISTEMIKIYDLRKLVLAGGDTAKQVCISLGAQEIELIGEVETGVPIGRVANEKDMFIISKAGGLGTLNVLKNALKVFRGVMAI